MRDAAMLLGIVESLERSFEERVEAAETLGLQGDPRALAEERVNVPAGPFLYRGSAGHPVRVHVSAFAIDRYPVTVAAYARFIEAGGYQTRRYWSRAGWAFRAREQIDKPRFWDDPAWAAYLVPNHPVVGVSVHEAEAYAAFRGARLPTEAEWEKAARGTDGRRYPWGNDWIDDACASREHGPRSTLPIGVFPRGRSPYGVNDVVGCVWQWCADAAGEAGDDVEPDDEDPFVDPEGYAEDAERVTRGGGWNNLLWSLSTTSRNGYPPEARFSNLGFRCVVGADRRG
ncbi:MAG: SUMF1/EgtB/PvdO family nonheme iron enzyme [Byssovorax sp.]